MNDALLRLLLHVHLTATLFMTGLIWFIQIVHYPLFADIGCEAFPAYERRHTELTTWVVGPAMLVEALTAVMLLWLRPSAVPLGWLVVGVILLGVIWLSTAFVQVPCHESLTRAFNPVVHQRLVHSNWVRTIAWSARSLLVAWMTMRGGV